ncbi:hypothetical protein M9H77_27288 [Catharanthus roseus]|uniref:Uncharacterized protein n=1 Tax=Catharanthus roseus TaxID=4058 RepID=A0ACC0AC99_CATRO|nr:hypothetical protein M9H77_27288 [Catharanthus roseus]
MKMKKRLNGSPMKKRKRKSFNRSPIPKCECLIATYILPGTFSSLAVASTPPWMSPSPASASIPPRMSTSLAAASIPLGTSLSLVATSLVETSTPPTLTPFSQLPYSSPGIHLYSFEFIYCRGISLRHSPSSSAHPLALAPSSAPSSISSSYGVVDCHIIILPTAYRRLVETGLIMIQGLDIRGVSGRVSARLGNYRIVTSLCDVWGSEAYKKRWEAAQQNQL